MTNAAAKHVFRAIKNAASDSEFTKKELIAFIKAQINALPNYYRTSSITRQALENLEAANWKSSSGVRRDHRVSQREFAEILSERAANLGFEEFIKLLHVCNEVTIVTKAQNPSRTAGYGHAYSEKDILYFSESVDTTADYSLPLTKRHVEIYRSAV